MILMKRNGFTLIELLAVIVILALIMTIAIPAITDTGSSARTKLTDIEKKNLIEAGKMLALDLDENTTDIYNCSGWVASACTKNNGKWTLVKVTVADLKTHDYYTDSKKHISESIKLEIKSDYTVTIDEN